MRKVEVKPLSSSLRIWTYTVILFQAIIEGWRFFMNASKTPIWREVNQCVDCLDEGHKHDEDLIIYKSALRGVESLLLTNLSDVTFEIL